MKNINICDSLEKVINHAWEKELFIFCKKHDIYAFSSQDTYIDFINMCEEQNLTDEIAYHIAILKHTLE